MSSQTTTITDPIRMPVAIPNADRFLSHWMCQILWNGLTFADRSAGVCSAVGRSAGLLLATVIGIAGALLGGFLAKALFGVQTLNTFFNLSTWVTAIVGAVVLFLLYGAVSGRGRRGRRA